MLHLGQKMITKIWITERIWKINVQVSLLSLLVLAIHNSTLLWFNPLTKIKLKDKYKERIERAEKCEKKLFYFIYMIKLLYK